VNKFATAIKRKRRRQLFLVLFLVLVSACSTVTCPIDTVVKCNYTFCDVEGADAVLQDTLNVDVRKGGRDTTLVSNLVSGSGFSVAMSYYNRVDTLILHYRQIALPDTIYVWHDGYTHVENPECGSYRFHILKDVRCTERGIDRLEIINPKVDYEGSGNIKVYFNSFAE
jgi:hypothetical protein